ncbi:MAG: hypothetical protein ACRD6B_04785 [Bryobacteraceae bacterium]
MLALGVLLSALGCDLTAPGRTDEFLGRNSKIHGPNAALKFDQSERVGGHLLEASLCKGGQFIMGRALNYATAPWFAARPLTVVIYWHPRHGPDALQNGHAALIIDSTQFSAVTSDWYVSWLGAGGANLFKQRGDAANFSADMQTWGGAQASPGSYLPSRWVAVSNLRMDLMKQEWDNIRTKQNSHWKLMDKNCATTVARVLKAGGSDQFATKSKSQLVWWPTDLIAYARSMNGCIVQDSRN